MGDAVIGAEASRDLLFELGHADVALGLVVIEGERKAGGLAFPLRILSTAPWLPSNCVPPRQARTEGVRYRQ
jgi:hypothetical protein